MEAPLTLYVWSKQRVLPVLLTKLSVTEEAFDINLNPIRAKICLENWDQGRTPETKA
jgi:hypothetical protein